MKPESNKKAIREAAEREKRDAAAREASRQKLLARLYFCPHDRCPTKTRCEEADECLDVSV